LTASSKVISTICGIFLLERPAGISDPPHRQSGSLHFLGSHFWALDKALGVGCIGFGLEAGLGGSLVWSFITKRRFVGLGFRPVL